MEKKEIQEEITSLLRNRSVQIMGISMSDKVLLIPEGFTPKIILKSARSL